jgi:hypothetical protein
MLLRLFWGGLVHLLLTPNLVENRLVGLQKNLGAVVLSVQRSKNGSLSPKKPLMHQLKG